MIVNRNTSSINSVTICANPGTATNCTCEWGRFFEVVLYVNGFPHKRILRKRAELLLAQVQRWVTDPAADWDDIIGVKPRGVVA